MNEEELKLLRMSGEIELLQKSREEIKLCNMLDRVEKEFKQELQNRANTLVSEWQGLKSAKRAAPYLHEIK
jgi:hypothetical protein